MTTTASASTNRVGRLGFAGVLIGIVGLVITLAVGGTMLASSAANTADATRTSGSGDVVDGWEAGAVAARAAQVPRAQDGWELALAAAQASRLERLQDGWEVSLRVTQAADLERAQRIQDGWERALLP